ncbi:MAG: hypothetical protein AAF393_14295 [Pseudomonadota bacterium]
MRTLLFLLLTTSTGWANCPTKEDMKSGIRFDVDENEYEIFRTVSNHVIEAKFHLEDGTIFRNLLGQGIYLLEVVDIENDSPVPSSRSTYTFPLAPVDLPLPTPGATWKTGVAILAPDGFDAEEQIYTFGEWTETNFGACTYKSMPISITYATQEEDLGTKDTLNWLPDLGISYLMATHDGSETTTYTYKSLRAVGK